jgi:hypothetical protein
MHQDMVQLQEFNFILQVADLRPANAWTTII